MEIVLKNFNNSCNVCVSNASKYGILKASQHFRSRAYKMHYNLLLYTERIFLHPCIPPIQAIRLHQVYHTGPWNKKELNCSMNIFSNLVTKIFHTAFLNKQFQETKYGLDVNHC